MNSEYLLGKTFTMRFPLSTFASIIAVFLHFWSYWFSEFSIVKEAELLKKVQKLQIYW